MNEFYDDGKSTGQLSEDGTYIEKIIIKNEKIVPLSLFCLSKLASLIIQSTPFENNIVPDALANLKTLEHFLVLFTPIKEITQQFSTLTNLEAITFYNCSLTYLPDLNKLHRLKTLHIPNNSLTQLDELSNAKLERLEISNNNFAEIPVLKNKEHLISLYSASNPLKNAKSIVLYPNLQVIDLNHATLMSIPSDIDKLQHLGSLIINDNQLTDLPLEIFNLSKLYFLNAENNLFSPENINLLKEKMKQRLPTAYLRV